MKNCNSKAIRTTLQKLLLFFVFLSIGYSGCSDTFELPDIYRTNTPEIITPYVTNTSISTPIIDSELVTQITTITQTDALAVTIPPTKTPTIVSVPTLINTSTPTIVSTPTSVSTITSTSTPTLVRISTNTPMPNVEIILNDPAPEGGSSIKFSWQMIRNEPLRPTECFALRLGNSPDNIHSIKWVRGSEYVYGINNPPGTYYWNIALVVDYDPPDMCNESGEIKGEDFDIIYESEILPVEFNYTTRKPPPTPPP